MMRKLEFPCLPPLRNLFRILYSSTIGLSPFCRYLQTSMLIISSPLLLSTTFVDIIGVYKKAIVENKSKT